jgi:RsiW-degrading membrane proteinase PrsW (M82 family)
MSQLLIVIIAISLAYVNSVPVNLMIRHGAKLWQEREFHNANYILKTLIAVFVSALTNSISWSLVVDAFLFGFIMWVVFDIVLNIFINHDWDYIGDTSKIDKKLNDLFLKKAGQIKAALCVLFIIGLNLLRNII